MANADFDGYQSSNRLSRIKGNGEPNQLSIIFHFMKARIVIYDDMCIIDETEVESKDKEQIKNIAINLLKTTPDAETAEVWVGKQLSMAFKTMKSGKIKAVTNVAHPNWGGAREKSGRPSKGKLAFRNRIVTHVNDEMYEYVENKNNKASWIRQAILEKMERESNNNQELTLDNHTSSTQAS